MALAAGAIIAATACVQLGGSHGGGQGVADHDSAVAARRIDAADVVVPTGYRIEAVAKGLTFPTAVAFDEDNRPYVLESGYSYGEVFMRPRLLAIEPDGSSRAIAVGESEDGPWNGVDYHDGAFYVADGGVLRGGRILRLDLDSRELLPIVTDLPSVGDHHVNGPAVSPDGSRLYFGIGTATNSGVVGTDNHTFGWLERFPDFHDIPARDVTLAGRNFTTEDPRTPNDDDQAESGAFVPFGTRTRAGQVVEGRLPCTGAIFSVPLDAAPNAGGGDRQSPAMELVAWGLRNPFGLAFDAAGRLFVTENSYDVRGSRPVWGTGDVLWRIDESGRWYGWPDFHAGEPLTWSDHYQAPGEEAPNFLLAEHPNEPPRPAAIFAVHASANGLDFSTSESFGHVGEAFVAEFGDMAPGVGKVLAPVGYRVVRVNVETGVIETFAVNRGDEYGPASKTGIMGLERPVAVRFDNTGEALYVVDFGVMTMGKRGPEPRAGTGVLWRITRGDALAAAASGEEETWP